MHSKIYMIRHAESPYVNGFEKTRGLSKAGKDAADKIASIFKEIDIDSIYSSDYVRAIKTVEPIANQKNIKIIELAQLRERLLKPEEVVLPYDDFIDAIRKSYNDHSFSLEGGESVDEVQNRAIPVIRSILENHKGKNIVIGTHGNVMTMIMKYYDEKYDFEFWKQTSTPDVYVMRFMSQEFVNIDRISFNSSQCF